MLSRLLALLPHASASTAAAPRLVLEQMPTRLYAIGDVHGCLGLLRQMEAAIMADAAAEPGGDSLIVLLGDLIDRGPASAQVLDHVLRRLPDGFRRVCLRGNHEQMMLDFLRRPRRHDDWLANGGIETLASYGVSIAALEAAGSGRALENLVASHIPQEHIELLTGLPVLLETPAAICVHAGLRPGVSVARQADHDLLWFRDGYRSDFAEFGRPVLHGHSPRAEPLVLPGRIAVDTAACQGGKLTSVRISAAQSPKILTITPDTSTNGLSQ